MRSVLQFSMPTVAIFIYYILFHSLQRLPIANFHLIRSSQFPGCGLRSDMYRFTPLVRDIFGCLFFFLSLGTQFIIYLKNRSSSILSTFSYRISWLLPNSSTIPQSISMIARISWYLNFYKSLRVWKAYVRHVRFVTALLKMIHSIFPLSNFNQELINKLLETNRI